MNKLKSNISFITFTNHKEATSRIIQKLKNVKLQKSQLLITSSFLQNICIKIFHFGLYGTELIISMFSSKQNFKNAQYIHVNIQTQVKTLQCRCKIHCRNGSRCSSTCLEHLLLQLGFLLEYLFYDINMTSPYFKLDLE